MSNKENLIQEYYTSIYSLTDNFTPYERFCNNLFKTFQIDLMSLVEMKFVICKQLNQPWETFDKLPYWEMEQMTNHLKKWIEREKEEREKEEGKSSNVYNQNKFMKDTQGMMKNNNFKPPSSGSISNIKPPNMSNFKI